MVVGKIAKLINFAEKKNASLLKRIQPTIDKINQAESSLVNLNDADLAKRTTTFKDQIANGATLDDLLVDAFATVREASRRVLGMRHHDVQLIGGIALHRGMIAEMQTGEGKTLVATLPAYLNALAGKGVHLVTVNDYLANRDATNLAPLYEFLGLSVGCITQNMDNLHRHKAYHSDITYGTNNEFGFDYLRDNMKTSQHDTVQRPFAYAIVDEVDSILIDEARTPLIISGPSHDESALYHDANKIVMQLQESDYEKEEKTKSISFTDQGYKKCDELARQYNMVCDQGLFQPEHMKLVHQLNQALKAQKVFARDTDYVIHDGGVVIIDEFTGRMMDGRRYSDGLHQALEAKEGVEIQEESQTLASITFQNYFRMYPKLAGMTGTASTEATEFLSIYNLPVLVVPTNAPVQRIDEDDEIFATFEEKKQAIVRKIQECHAKNQPVLVGTLSIEKSEIFSMALTEAGLPHNVLNARHHAKEADIIANAGQPGAITIATNMAGRGTDIKLGGNIDKHMTYIDKSIDDPSERQHAKQDLINDKQKREDIVRKAGGLFVLGTERNESRRIDNQLRGRSARQGDPGVSKFFISLDDDLMRIFGPNLNMMRYSLTSGKTANEPIVHPWITRAIEKAQQRVEKQHFETRKNLLRYADVLNAQRGTIYNERRTILNQDDMRPFVAHTIDIMVNTIVDTHAQEKKPNYTIKERVADTLNITLANDTPWDRASLTAFFTQRSNDIFAYLDKKDALPLVKSLMLKILDTEWTQHLSALEILRNSIHLLSYGQKDPLNEYKHEAFMLYNRMVHTWHSTFLRLFFGLDTKEMPVFDQDDEMDSVADMDMDTHTPELPTHHTSQDDTIDPSSATSHIDDTAQPSHAVPLSRNRLCDCGSGKRYKHCHGQLTPSGNDRHSGA